VWQFCRGTSIRSFLFHPPHPEQKRCRRKILVFFQVDSWISSGKNAPTTAPHKAVAGALASVPDIWSLGNSADLRYDHASHVRAGLNSARDWTGTIRWLR
jgi:hypothetical protein